MVVSELKLKIDAVWNSIWSGRITSPLSVIEQYA